MQKISTKNLHPGMVLARNIFSADGILLLSADTVLNSTQIERLQQFDLLSVYIKNPLTDHLTDKDMLDAIPEVVREETRMQAVQVVHTAFQNFSANHRLESQPFKDTAEFLMKEVIENPGAMVHLTDIRTCDGYTFGHSVNVCVLSTLTGIQLGYNRFQLKELSLGALLHDAGKMLIAKEILTKAGPLTVNERKSMEHHPTLGFDILRRQGDIPLVSAHVAFQHHEKFNGTGYTRGLKGIHIHEYARIVAIADVYDAITSDRPYKEGSLPHQAYEIMLSLANTHFDPTILRTFLNQIAIYPVGSIVRLTTGEIAVVTKVIPGLQTRPALKVIFDASGSKLENGPEIDLAQQLTVFIDKVFTAAEVAKISFGNMYFNQPLRQAQ